MCLEWCEGIHCLLHWAQDFYQANFALTVNAGHWLHVQMAIKVSILLLPQGPSLQLDLDGQITSTSQLQSLNAMRLWGEERCWRIGDERGGMQTQLRKEAVVGPGRKTAVLAQTTWVSQPFNIGLAFFQFISWREAFTAGIFIKKEIYFTCPRTNCEAISGYVLFISNSHFYKDQPSQLFVLH